MPVPQHINKLCTFGGTLAGVWGVLCYLFDYFNISFIIEQFYVFL